MVIFALEGDSLLSWVILALAVAWVLVELRRRNA
jgi:hypothetical protein